MNTGRLIWSNNAPRHSESDLAAMLVDTPPQLPYRQRVVHILITLTVFVALAAASGVVSRPSGDAATVSAPAAPAVERAELR